MQAIRFAAGICVLLLSGAAADGAIYDIADGLYNNVVAGAIGGPASQPGNDGWYFKYERVWPWGGWQGIPISRDPADFVDLEYAFDGSTRRESVSVGGAAR